MTSPDNEDQHTLAEDARALVGLQAPFTRAIDALERAGRCLA
jgi:hypothetical protein